jgi:RNA polymerase sigma-70 factor (ECF subfamily)
MSRSPENEVLQLLRQRDPEGFNRAYALFASPIHAFLYRLAGRKDQADDLLQHTFLRLAERGPELRADSDLRAWLFAVARNAFLGLARATRSELREEAIEEVVTPPTDVEARLLLGDVERALTALRLGDRELLLLVGVEGLEPSQVASVLGIDAATLRKRLARARARLLAELAKLPSLRQSPGKKAHP